MGALEKKPKSGDKPPTFLFKKFRNNVYPGFMEKKPKKKINYALFRA